MNKPKGWFPLDQLRPVLGGFLVAATAAFAGGNFLPDRDTPVPSDQPIPTVDFVRPALFESPDLNPSGTRFAAFSESDQVNQLVVICDLQTGKIESTDSGISGFDWMDDRHLLLYFRTGSGAIDIHHPRRQLLVSDVLSGNRGFNRDTGFLWSWPMNDRPVAWSSGWVLRVWNSPETGYTAYCLTIQDDGRRHLYRRDGSRWVESPVDLDEITPVALGTGPKQMLAIGPAGRGQPRALQILDTVTGKLGDVLYRDPLYDCLPVVYLKRDTMTVIGVAVASPVSRTVWFDHRMAEVQGMIDHQFQGAVASIESTDIHEQEFMIETKTDRQAPAYLLLDYDKRSLRLIKKVQPWLDPARMAPRQLIDYKSRDGATIEAYLTLPPGASKEHPAPAVVEIHGGPWTSRYSWGLDRTAQFFVSHGYAVFQPNYRGSPGYNSRFAAADLFDFQKMSDDVVDGVHALIRSGLIDGRRIAALGYGFGSYLAVCEAVDEPNLYRCAMIYGGIFDWDRHFRKKDSPSMFEDEWVERRLHDYHLTPPAPLQRKESIKIPFFMTRNVETGDSTEDTQIYEFYDAMRGRVPCEFFGDLNLRRRNEAYSEVVDRLDRFVTFLGKYCGPK